MLMMQCSNRMYPERGERDGVWVPSVLREHFMSDPLLCNLPCVLQGRDLKYLLEIRYLLWGPWDAPNTKQKLHWL